MIKNISLLASALVLGACITSAGRAAAPQPSELCSIINLIATPGDYDGKRVRTTGVARFQGRRGAIYLSTEESIHGMGLNGIALSLKEFNVSDDALERLDFKHVMVEGTFHVRKEERSMLRGEISDVTRLYAID